MSVSVSVSVEKVSRRFGSFAALESVSLAAEPGEFLALLGPSGSGKTTLLRILAGLETPDTGRVLFDREDVTALPVARRRVGFVFQHYALFRHMTVRDNIGFGLSVRPRHERPFRAAIHARAEELLGLVQLAGLGGRYPEQLSGGQRQRVALARALAVEPRLLLLDEPFGALDAQVRKELRRWLRDRHDRLGLTTIFVTHDQDEALELADRVVVMDHGRIAQVDTPANVYGQPASAWVCSFVGEANRVPVRVEGGVVSFHDRIVDLPPGPRPDGAADLWFRPHDARIANDCTGCLPIIVSRTHAHAGRTRVEGSLPGLERPIEVDVSPDVPVPGPGTRIGLVITHAQLFSREEDQP